MKQSEIKELSTAELQEKLSETKKSICRFENDTCNITSRKPNPIAQRKT
jgi:ribosomal protein L29